MSPCYSNILPLGQEDEPQPKRSKIEDAPSEEDSQDGQGKEGESVDGAKLPEKIDLGKESAIEAEVLAARQRAIIPLEERMKEFRGMLAEKEACTLYEGVLRER